MRGEDGVFVRGKFTPIRSGHLPPQREVHALYGMPTTGSRRGQLTMTGALTNDQPARVVRFEDRDRNADSNPRDREGHAGRNAGAKKQQTKNRERTEKWRKSTSWFFFCCGLCETWDLAAEGQQQNGVQETAVKGGRRVGRS